MKLVKATIAIWRLVVVSALIMPPKPSPNTLRTPILRKHTWCMTCLSVSVKEWDEESMATFRPFAVKCHAATYDGKNCLHCNHLHKVCEPVCSRRRFGLTPGVIRTNLACSLGPRRP